MRLSTRRLLLTADDRRVEVTIEELAACGGWAGVFGAPGPLTLEIGIGKDTHLLERALARPDGRFVGIEYTRKKIDKGISKVAQRGGAENLRVLFADVTRALETVFPSACLERVYALFPDPWPKLRHRRRRIIAPEFLARLIPAMLPGARLEVRTDDLDYRDSIAAVLDGEPRLGNLVAPLPWLTEPRDPADHVPTLFERKYRLRGIPIHYFYRERIEG